MTNLRRVRRSYPEICPTGLHHFICLQFKLLISGAITPFPSHPQVTRLQRQSAFQSPKLQNMPATLRGARLYSFLISFAKVSPWVLTRSAVKPDEITVVRAVLKVY